MAQGVSTTTNKGDSPAGRAMDEAIELDLAGRRSPYPKRASFIDADAPYVGKAIRRAVEGDYAVVLVATDGSALTLRAEPTRRRSRLTRPGRWGIGIVGSAAEGARRLTRRGTRSAAR